jgi:hypothetical protein
VSNEDVGIEEDIRYRAYLYCESGKQTWTLSDLTPDELADIKRRILGRFPIERGNIVLAAGAVAAMQYYSQTKTDE